MLVKSGFSLRSGGITDKESVTTARDFFEGSSVGGSGSLEDNDSVFRERSLSDIQNTATNSRSSLGDLHQQSMPPTLGGGEGGFTSDEEEEEEEEKEVEHSETTSTPSDQDGQDSLQHSQSTLKASHFSIG